MTTLLSSIDNIFLGKIPYVPKWKLSIEAYPVLTKNLQVYDISTSKNYPEIHPADKINVHVFYDDELIIENSLANPTSVCKEIIDDPIDCEHSIQCYITGKTDDHSLIQESDHITISVAIVVKIEHLPVNLALFGKDILLLGENNKKYHAMMQTPIYHWLIDNSTTIIDQLGYK